MGGAISTVSKNWKLFVVRLSGFWLREMLLDHPEQKMFLAKQKNEGKNWPDPLVMIELFEECIRKNCLHHFCEGFSSRICQKVGCNRFGVFKFCCEYPEWRNPTNLGMNFL